MEALQTESNVGIDSRQKLLRILGLGFGLAVVVGSTIGVGILRAPGAISAQLGSVWLVLLMWLLGSIYTLMCANYTAELATMLPKAGGPYVYARHAYGNYGGFLIGWSDWLANTTPLAYLPIAFAEFSGQLLPSLEGKTTAIAITILLVFTILNWTGLRLGSNTQKLISFVKAAALLIFVAACFALGGQKSSAGEEIAASKSFSDIFVGAALSFQLVLGTFGGWFSVIYFAEEDKNPSSNIPRSLFGGILMIIGIYLLVNVALFYVLPISQVAASKLPAADAMIKIFGASGGQIVTVLSLISLLGILNAILMFVPRTLYALSRDGLFWSKASEVNKGGTPVFALAITTLIASLLILTGTFEKLFVIYAFFATANTVILIGALFILRKREPNLARPFKTWGYPWLPILLMIVSLVLFITFVISDVKNALYPVLLIAASYPIYLLLFRKAKASANSI
jgi:APA family basic amino acid/polyamine antiporter